MKLLLFVLFIGLGLNAYAAETKNFGVWKVQRTTDKITDKKLCNLFISNSYKGKFGTKSYVLSTVEFKDKSGLILTSDSLYASKGGFIRIDQEEAIENASTMDNSLLFITKNLMEKLHPAKTLLVRFHEYPSMHQITKEISMKGFESAYKEWQKCEAK